MDDSFNHEEIAIEKRGSVVSLATLKLNPNNIDHIRMKIYYFPLVTNRFLQSKSKNLHFHCVQYRNEKKNALHETQTLCLYCGVTYTYKWRR